MVDFCFRASLVGKDICVAPGGQPLRVYKPRLVGSFLCQKSLQFSLNHALLDVLRSFEIVFSQSRCTHALACSTSATSLRCLHPAGLLQWLAARLLCWARGTVKRMDYTYRMLAVLSNDRQKIIISALSSPSVLSVSGIQNWARYSGAFHVVRWSVDTAILTYRFRSVGYSTECFGIHIGGFQTANLGDGRGWTNELGVIRYDYGDILLGTCIENLTGATFFFFSFSRPMYSDC